MSVQCCTNSKKWSRLGCSQNCCVYLIESGVLFVLGFIHEYHNTVYWYILTVVD